MRQFPRTFLAFLLPFDGTDRGRAWTDTVVSQHSALPKPTASSYKLPKIKMAC